MSNFLFHFNRLVVNQSKLNGLHQPHKQRRIIPHPIPVAYQGPAARHKLSQLRNIPTTNQHNANKDRSLPASHGQLKGEWAPIVCKKVPDPQQTVTGQLREGTGLSAVTPNSLPVPQQSIPDQFQVDQYPQNILRESLTTSTLKPTLDPQDNLSKFLLISTPAPEVYSQSAVTESLPTSTLTADLYTPGNSPQSLPKTTDTQELCPRNIAPKPQSTSILTHKIHLKTTSTRLSTAIQESLPKPETPDRILVHSRIVIEGEKGIIPLIICCWLTLQILMEKQ